LIGEIIGHWLHDLLARWYIKRHNGRLEPEARLAVIWLSTPWMLAGLILLGFCLQDGYHYMITSLAWGLYVFGIMVTTVGISSYILDSYPEVRSYARFFLGSIYPSKADFPTGFRRSCIMAELRKSLWRLHHLLLPGSCTPKLANMLQRF
jgi:hypothetical protein